LEVRQQPPIIATQHPPSCLPPSHIAQFGTIAENQAAQESDNPEVLADLEHYTNEVLRENRIEEN
jgi:hypothetical protein